MKSIDRIWTGLAILLLLLTFTSCVCVATFFVNPSGVLSFLAPPTLPLPALLATPEPFLSATPVITFPTLPPEWTAAPAASPTKAAITATETPAVDPNTATPGTPVGPTATATDEPLPTRTVTPTVPPPTRTGTPGSYPAEPGVPTATSAPGGYP
jgi:hypothetical protein